MRNRDHKSTGEIAGFRRYQRGITGLETAIVLIAFVVVSSVFAFAALSTGLFSSDKSKKTIHAGLGETRGTLEVKGGLRLNATLTSQTTITTGNDSSTISFTLTQTPVVPGSETLTSGASTTLTLGTDYLITYDTGKITLTNGMATSADNLTATYKKYVVDSVDVELANAAGGQPVDMTPGQTLVTYIDDDDKFNSTNYGLTPLGTANGDNFLEGGEIHKINVNISTGNLTDGDEFTINIKPPQGAVVNLSRRVPPKIDTVMAVN